MAIGPRPPLRIAVLCESFGRDGGAGAHVVDSVAELRAAGHQVLVLADRWDRSAGDATPLAGLAGGEDAAVATALELLGAFGPEVVHAHDIYDGRVLGASTERWPTVVSVHNHATCASGHRYLRPGQECRKVHGVGCLPVMLSGRCTHRLDPRPVPVQFRATTRRIAALRLVDTVVAHSRFVADDVARSGARAVAVIPYGVPDTDVTPPPAARRILFVGRVVEAKGLRWLLEALADVDAELDVHGEGWWLPDAEALATRLGIADRVTFHGWSGAAALADAYHATRIVCVPSVWPEPFGIVGIEAMAHGRPVVAADTGGIGEWLEDGVTGRLVPPGDAPALARALTELLDDPARCEALGTAGRAVTADRFSPEHHVAVLTDLYRGVIGTPRPGR